MTKNMASNNSFLKSSFASVDLQSTLGIPVSGLSELKTFLCEMVIHTSMPLCLSFQKLLTFNNSQDKEQAQTFLKYTQTLKLLIACLKCVQEWKVCLRQVQAEIKSHTGIVASGSGSSSASGDMLLRKLILDNLSRILNTSSQQNRGESNFFTMLNLDLLAKYLPKFDAFSNLNKFILNEYSSTSSLSDELIGIINDYFEIFSLYSDIFMNRTVNSSSSSSLFQLVSDDLSESFMETRLE